jgi:hypothetical protein
MQRLAIALTAINLALLFLTVAQSTTAQNVAPILRAGALEIVDERGVMRARLGVKGSGVIELDLFDPKGTIRVKLGAGEDGSGLVLGDGTAPLPIHLLARNRATADKPATTHITLKGPGGRDHVIRP